MSKLKIKDQQVVKGNIIISTDYLASRTDCTDAFVQALKAEDVLSQDKLIQRLNKLSERSNWHMFGVLTSISTRRANDVTYVDITNDVDEVCTMKIPHKNHPQAAERYELYFHLQDVFQTAKENGVNVLLETSAHTQGVWESNKWFDMIQVNLLASSSN